MTLTSTNPEGALCKTTQKIAFPDCRLKSREITDETILENRLTVSPNPTRDATGLTYTFANEKAQVRSLEIYSLMGVLLEKYTPETQNGVWNINLGRYAAGQYIVVMKEDGVEEVRTIAFFLSFSSTSHRHPDRLGNRVRQSCGDIPLRIPWLHPRETFIQILSQRQRRL